MKKFVFDMNQTSFTEKGKKIIAYFDEYLVASDLIKDAIRKAVSFEAGSTRFLRLFDQCETHDKFCEELAKNKSLIKKDFKDIRMVKAHEFVESYCPSKNLPYIIKDGNSLDNIIICYKIGFKSTTISDTFDFKATTKKTCFNNFKEHENFIKDFLNFYVRKNVLEFFSTKDLDDLKVDISLAEKTNHWCDLSVNISINIDNLSDELCKKAFGIIKELNSATFY